GSLDVGDCSVSGLPWLFSGVGLAPPTMENVPSLLVVTWTPYILPTCPCRSWITLSGTLVIVSCCPLTFRTTVWVLAFTETIEPDRDCCPFETPAQALNKIITTRTAILRTTCRRTEVFIVFLLHQGKGAQFIAPA